MAQSLVVVPAQYQRDPADPTNNRQGKFRLYRTLTFQVAYTPVASTLSNEFTPPALWSVRAAGGAIVGTNMVSTTVTVDTSDASGVVRVLANYTSANGVWSVAELQRVPGSDLWKAQRTLPKTTRLYIQAIDAAGNVAQSDAKGVSFILNRRLAVSRNSLTFTQPLGAPIPTKQDVVVRNDGDDQLQWVATSRAPWLILSRTQGDTGASASSLSLSIDPTRMQPGVNRATITVTSPTLGVVNAVQQIEITAVVPGRVLLPFVRR